MTPTKMRLVSSTRAVTTPSAALSFCRFSTGKRTTALAMPARPTTTSERAPHITPVSLPAPRTKSAWSFTGSYTARVGMDTNVIRYSTPARRALLLIGFVVARATAGVCAVVVMGGLPFVVGDTVRAAVAVVSELRGRAGEVDESGDPAPVRVWTPTTRSGPARSERVRPAHPSAGGAWGWPVSSRGRCRPGRAGTADTGRSSAPRRPPPAGPTGRDR